MVARVIGAFLAIVLTNPSLLPAAGRGPAEPITRTVYVTVTDGKGAAVTDLTAADFAVKEGGKARDIVSAEPAKLKMRTAVMIDERLLGDGPTRNGVFEFLKRLQPTSEFALITVGLRNQTVVDYTSDLTVIVAAINKFTLNPGPVSNFSESVLDVTKKLTRAAPRAAGDRRARAAERRRGGQRLDRRDVELAAAKRGATARRHVDAEQRRE